MKLKLISSNPQVGILVSKAYRAVRVDMLLWIMVIHSEELRVIRSWVGIKVYDTKTK